MTEENEEEKTVWNGSDETKKPDWEKEAENLSTGMDVDFFEVPKGQTEIKFLNDGEIYETQKEWDDQPNQYFRVRVEVDGEEYVWDMNRATTPTSKYGQIVRFARVKGGLEGETVSWYRQGTGTNTNHMLMGLEELEEEAGIDSDSE